MATPEQKLQLKKNFRIQEMISWVGLILVIVFLPRLDEPLSFNTNSVLFFVVLILVRGLETKYRKAQDKLIDSL